MSEYVKKTPFGGYKEVQGGYSSSEWEYVILTRKEYNNQETELRVAKAGKSEAEEKARKNIDRANVEAKREINEAYKAADEQVSPPSKNGHRKATKNGMNRSHSFIFLKTAAFIPRFT